jgi:hypothetical protein
MNSIMRWLETLRFPVLVVLAGVLFVVDLVMPDPLPLIDEFLFALVTLILSRIKRPSRRSGKDDTGR